MGAGTGAFFKKDSTKAAADAFDEDDIGSFNVDFFGLTLILLPFFSPPSTTIGYRPFKLLERGKL
jgi:hypothetical protein